MRLRSDEKLGLAAAVVLHGALVAVLLVSLVRAPEGRVARVLGSAPLVALGTVSFGLYLWHYPVQWALWYLKH
jgi:peptidoglycan/LPS O-acetylase OafA/YrhL